MKNDLVLKRRNYMKKEDLKNLMIVINGLEEMFLILGDKNNFVMIKEIKEDKEGNDEIYGFEADQFNEDLICIEDIPSSIIEIYDCLPIKSPFEFYLNVEKLFNKYEPKLLWKRDPSPLSKSKLESFNNNENAMKYVNSIVQPYIIVE